MTDNTSGAEAVLQRQIGYAFHNPELLRQALTHSSWANEHHKNGAHNERLEFLGDAVLELAISTFLYSRFQDSREGELTRMRSALVREESLARIAKSLSINSALLLGKGERQQKGSERDSLLADALEAVLGAVYLDGGFEAALEVVGRIFIIAPQEISPASPVKNPKSLAQEICQKRYNATPVYTLIRATGPDHARIFEVELSLPDGRHFRGRGNSCKKAGQNAAEQFLKEAEA